MSPWGPRGPCRQGRSKLLWGPGCYFCFGSPHLSCLCSTFTKALISQACHALKTECLLYFQEKCLHISTPNLSQAQSRVLPLVGKCCFCLLCLSSHSLKAVNVPQKYRCMFVVVFFFFVQLLRVVSGLELGIKSLSLSTPIHAFPPNTSKSYTNI